MEKYAPLLGYFDKQVVFIKKIHNEITHLDIHNYDKRFVFALKTQQFYTAIEDLFKQVAKSFENHIKDLAQFHKELLIRMNTEIPTIRPSVISQESLIFLDKIGTFHQFIHYAYDCELNVDELASIQEKLKKDFSSFEKDLEQFRRFVYELSLA